MVRAHSNLMMWIKTQRLNFKLDQQLIGPLLFSYEGYINLDNGSSKYGDFSQQTFGLILEDVHIILALFIEIQMILLA